MNYLLRHRTAFIDATLSLALSRDPPSIAVVPDDDAEDLGPRSQHQHSAIWTPIIHYVDLPDVIFPAGEELWSRAGDVSMLRAADPKVNVDVTIDTVGRAQPKPKRVLSGAFEGMAAPSKKKSKSTRGSSTTASRRDAGVRRNGKQRDEGGQGDGGDNVAGSDGNAGGQEGAAELLRMQAEIEALRQEVRQARHDQEAQQARHHQADQGAQAEMQRLNTEVAVLRQQAVERQAEQEQRELIASARETDRAEITALRRELQALHGRQTEAGGQVRPAVDHEQHAAIVADRDRVHLEVTQLRRQLHEIKNLNELRDRQRRLENRIAYLQNEHDELEEAVDKLKQRKKELKNWNELHSVYN